MSNSPRPRGPIIPNAPQTQDRPSAGPATPSGPREFRGQAISEKVIAYAATEISDGQESNRSGNGKNAQADPLLGKVIGEKYQYHIESLLGKGGMGAVYRAEKIKEDGNPIAVGTPVALKLVLRENEILIKRFQKREAPALVKLTHPNIVRVYDFGIHQDPDGLRFPYLVMELLEGEDLSKKIKNEGKLGVGITKHIGIQISAALMQVHSFGIVHRDMKPSNLYIIRFGEDPVFVKLLDFGLAKFEGGPLVDSFLTSSGAALMGTPHYNSPEQAFGQKVDGRSDIFSAGIILYEMATGQLPFTGASLGEVTNKIMYETPRPPSLVSPEIPIDLENLIMRTMSKNAAGRPSAEALMNGLKACGSGVEAYRLSVSETIADDSAAPPARRSDSTKREGVGTKADDQNQVETLDENPTEVESGSRGGRTGRIIAGVAVLSVGIAIGAGALYHKQLLEMAGVGPTASIVPSSSSASSTKPGTRTVSSSSAGPILSSGQDQVNAATETHSHKVKISTNPNGAIVSLLESGGKTERIGHTVNPLEKDLPIGKQTLVITKAGYPERRIEIDSDTKSIEINLGNGKADITKNPTSQK